MVYSQFALVDVPDHYPVRGFGLKLKHRGEGKGQDREKKDE